MQTGLGFAVALSGIGVGEIVGSVSPESPGEIRLHAETRKIANIMI